MSDGPALLPQHLVGLMIPVTYVVMVGIEYCGTGWRWPAVRGWQLVGIAGFLLVGLVNGVISGMLVRLDQGVHLIDGARLGAIPGALVGYVFVSLGNAGLHRAYHRYGWLWRHVHQLHHAPPRLDVAGVMFQTPWEMAANAVLFTGVTVVLLGLNPLASMLCAWLAAFFGMFQHFNIRTPVWFGWFIQRPEAHCEHHRRGVHAWNYSDVPLWDMLWGTLRNPPDFSGELGFAPSVAGQWREMLLGHDVNASDGVVRGSATPSTNPA